MTEDFCCCPGCGSCSAHRDAPAQKQRIKDLRKALRGMLSVWDSACSAQGWDKDHTQQAIDARKLLGEEVRSHG